MTESKTRRGLLDRIRNDIAWTWLAIEVVSVAVIVLAYFLLG
ncbi:MAG TPA: hypothetical protein VF039_08960 [Longimicrobiales bacterium]